MAVFFNGVRILTNFVTISGGATTTSASVALKVGFNPISIVYFDSGVHGQFGLSFSIGGGPFVIDGSYILYAITSSANRYIF